MGDGPEVFGLHSNADITYMTTTAQTVLSTIVDIQPKESSGGGGETREDVVTRLCNEFLEKLPASFVPHEVKARLKKMGATAPMNIFLRQEIDRIQRVIQLVRTTLNDLLLAIDGTIIMGETLRDALDNMYDARVPKAWAAISWTSATLGFCLPSCSSVTRSFTAGASRAGPTATGLRAFSIHRALSQPCVRRLRALTRAGPWTASCAPTMSPSWLARKTSRRRQRRVCTSMVCSWMARGDKRNSC